MIKRIMILDRVSKVPKYNIKSKPLLGRTKTGVLNMIAEL
jgi:hypothetical protein